MTSEGIRANIERDMEENPAELEVVERSDRFRDSRAWMTSPYFVRGGPGSRTGSLPGITFAGAGVANGPDHPDDPNAIYRLLVFESDAQEWRFLTSDLEVNLILDGSDRLHLGPATHKGEVGGLAVVGVAETMEVVVTEGQLRRIANARSVEVQVGSVEFALRPNQVAALRQLIATTEGELS